MILYSSLLQVREIDHGFCAAGSEPEGIRLPQQVHGSRVVACRRLGRNPADGLWARRPATIGVRTADCVPILMAHSNGEVAAIHAGWRGAAQHICENHIIRRARYDVAPQEWTVALGPAAGACCYQVGPEVFAALGLDRLQGKDKKGMLDLRLLLRDRLNDLGVRSVDIVGPCTICGPQIWASYRRQGQAAGRNISFISVP